MYPTSPHASTDACVFGYIWREPKDLQSHQLLREQELPASWGRSHWRDIDGKGVSNFHQTFALKGQQLHPETAAISSPNHAAAKMKFTITLVAMAAQLAGLAAAVPATTEPADCGELGVLEWKAEDFKDRPDVDLGAIRKCNEPFAPGKQPHDPRAASSAKRDDDLLGNPLHKRACWYGKEFGCTDGRCWKKCGDGPWCWTARNGGFGGWYTCGKDSDCNTGQSCGQSTGSCKECGCSC
ncbi:hypothetical protein RB594_009256 [Gaeumannomyces avenae]